MSKKKSKRIKVAVNDLVQIRTYANHYSGSIGKVVDVIDKDRFIYKAIAVNDMDFWGTEWVAYTRKPTGTTKGGSPKENYRPFVTKVVLRATPLPPKKVKPPKPVKVIKTKADLHEALTEPTKGHRIVVALEPDQEAVLDRFLDRVTVGEPEFPRLRELMVSPPPSLLRGPSIGPLFTPREPAPAVHDGPVILFDESGSMQLSDEELRLREVERQEQRDRDREHDDGR